MRLEHPASDTKEEEDDDDQELANEVDPESSIPPAAVATFYTEDDDNNDNNDNDNDNNDNDNKLVDEVDPEPSSPQTPMVRSGNDKGKEKSPLKPGCLSSEDKEEICAFSVQVLNMAQDVVDCLRISRKNVLISAGLGIKESHHKNIANLHSQWYATTYTKPEGCMCLCTSSFSF